MKSASVCGVGNEGCWRSVGNCLAGPSVLLMMNGRMSNHLYEDWKDRTSIRAFSLSSVSDYSVSVSASATIWSALSSTLSASVSALL